MNINPGGKMGNTEQAIKANNVQPKKNIVPPKKTMEPQKNNKQVADKVAISTSAKDVQMKATAAKASEVKGMATTAVSEKGALQTQGRVNKIV